MCFVSFSCLTGDANCCGDKIADCAAYLDGVDQVIAIGANCTPPEFIEDLTKNIRTKTKKRILAYPNSGEIYDCVKKTWAHPATDIPSFVALAYKWKEAGCSMFGGCCRTNYDYISALREVADK